MNPAYLSLFGFPPGTDLAGTPVLDLIAPESRELVRGHIERRLRGEPVPLGYETRGIRTDGTTFHMGVSLSLYNEGGETLTLAILRDITDRKVAERDSAEREALLQQILNTANVAIFLVDRSGRITHANRGMATMFRCGVEDLVGSEYVSLVHPSEREIGRRKMLALLASEIESVDLERHYWRRDGKEFWGHLAGRRFQDIEGKELGLIGVITDIDTRRRVEEALRESEARYRQLYEGTPVMMHSIDARGVLISVSDEWLQTLGYTREEVLGRLSTEFLDEQSRRYARDVVLPEFVRTGVCRDVPYTFLKKTGEAVSTLLSAIGERDESGKVIRSLAVILDVTERRLAEERLRESEGRLRVVTEHAPDTILQVDRQGTIAFVNRPVVGLTREQIVGSNVVGWVPDEQKPVVLQALDDVFTTGERREYESAGPGPNGTTRDYGVRVMPVVIDGRIDSAVYVATDITERKTAEAALRESEERYRQLFEGESDAILLIDNGTGRILMANNAASMMYGFAREELLAMANMDLSAEPSETRRVTEQSPICIDNTVTIPLRYHRKKDGTVFPVEITGRFFEYQGRPVHIAAIRDITERMEAEEALRRSEERFRDLAEFLPLTVFEVDMKGRFTFVNRAAVEAFGYEREEFYSDVTLDGLLAPGDRERARLLVAKGASVDAGGYPEFRAVRKGGMIFPVSIASTPIMREGEPIGIRGIVVNLLERKQLEEERLKSQKLESIGTLAGGIAHDFNNLLQGVFGYISMAKATLGGASRPHDLLDRAELALHQAVRLTAQLLTFSKGGKPVKRVLALRPIIETAVRFASSGSRTAFEMSFDDDLSTVEADEGQLVQVFQNIVLNAQQAMPMGGTLRVSARNLTSAPPGMEPGSAVEIRITDQGVGIPADHLAKIFDPYFTTKDRGSGLGLATAYSIVRNHGGMISVESESGRGATFTVCLPASGAPTDQQRESSVLKGARKGRILVMDDEALVRDVVRELLASLGHDAVFATKGEEALERYREAAAAGQPFDLVILDLTIRGGLGGLETVQALRDYDPSVKAVVSTGYSDDSGLADYERRGFKAFLKKPFVLKDLEATLARLLR